MAACCERLREIDDMPPNACRGRLREQQNLHNGWIAGDLVKKVRLNLRTGP